jgi:hypothetical protein
MKKLIEQGLDDHLSPQTARGLRDAIGRALGEIGEAG